MPKRGVTKEKLSVTIKKEVLQKFNRYCEENSINKSNKIERFIEEFLKKEEL